jgi:hypothetical protein
MYTACTLYVHRMYTDVHRMYTICTPYVHCMYTVCTLYVHCMYTGVVSELLQWCTCEHVSPLSHSHTIVSEHIIKHRLLRLSNSCQMLGAYARPVQTAASLVVACMRGGCAPAVHAVLQVQLSHGLSCMVALV